MVAASGVAALVLAACGGDRNDTGAAYHGGHQATDSASAASSAPASQGQHNAADVSFAKGMIPTTVRLWRWPTSRLTGPGRPR